MENTVHRLRHFFSISLLGALYCTSKQSFPFLNQLDAATRHPPCFCSVFIPGLYLYPNRNKCLSNNMFSFYNKMNEQLWPRMFPFPAGFFCPPPPPLSLGGWGGGGSHWEKSCRIFKSYSLNRVNHTI